MEEVTEDQLSTLLMKDFERALTIDAKKTLKVVYAFLNGLCTKCEVRGTF